MQRDAGGGSFRVLYFVPKAFQIKTLNFKAVYNYLIFEGLLYLEYETIQIFKVKKMIVGVPKEIKNNENRVGLTPAGVVELVKNGHKVYVQSTAGEGSGFSNMQYEAAGAEILNTIEETYAAAEMIVKVKEPIEKEYDLIKEGQILFTYFHFASYRPLTEAMMRRKAICIAYETVEKADRSLPLLIPMSEVAGRMAVQQGAKYLEKPAKGRGGTFRRRARRASG